MALVNYGTWHSAGTAPLGKPDFGEWGILVAQGDGESDLVERRCKGLTRLAKRVLLRELTVGTKIPIRILVLVWKEVEPIRLPVGTCPRRQKRDR